MPLSPLPPPIHSGYSWNDIRATVPLIYDSNTGISPTGGLRAMTPADLAGTSVGGGGASSANQSTQINQFNNLINSGVSIKNSGIFSSGILTSPAAMTGNSGVAGSFSILQLSSETKALFVQPPNLEKSNDTVTAFPPMGAALATGGRQGPIVGGSGATLLAANSNRKQIFLQNLSPSGLYVSLSGSANLNNWNFILKGGTSQDDGLGGTWSADNWLGSLSVSGLATSGFRVACFEF